MTGVPYLIFHKVEEVKNLIKVIFIIVEKQCVVLINLTLRWVNIEISNVLTVPTFTSYVKNFQSNKNLQNY